jgi:hypothetical protein
MNLYIWMATQIESCYPGFEAMNRVTKDIYLAAMWVSALKVSPINFRAWRYSIMWMGNVW